MTREQAERAVDNIFADLRDRRTLKWLFDPEPENCGPIAPGVDVIGREVQAEIRETWIGLVMAASQ
jgi:hypothetical protein